jgi:CspA family cold shock protein
LENLVIRIISLIEMQKGTIVRLNNGFGFIKQEGSDKDLFFHANELKNVEFNDLREGDELTFEVAEGPKGLNAVEVNKA